MDLIEMRFDNKDGYDKKGFNDKDGFQQARF